MYLNGVIVAKGEVEVSRRGPLCPLDQVFVVYIGANPWVIIHKGTHFEAIDEPRLGIGMPCRRGGVPDRSRGHIVVQQMDISEMVLQPCQAFVVPLKPCLIGNTNQSQENQKARGDEPEAGGQSGVSFAPFPGPFERPGRSGFDRFVAEKSFEVLAKGLGGRVATGGLFFETFETDSF